MSCRVFVEFDMLIFVLMREKIFSFGYVESNVLRFVDEIMICESVRCKRDGNFWIVGLIVGINVCFKIRCFSLVFLYCLRIFI